MKARSKLMQVFFANNRDFWCRWCFKIGLWARNLL